MYDKATWIIISLSKKVIHQKRNVYNIFMMFGDVGGLNDFLCLLISPVFGLFSDYLLNGDMVQKMFHSTSKPNAGDHLQNTAYKATPK